MRPDVPMRLRSMVKAMTETVLPELAGRPAALAQAEIVVGSLEMLEEQIDHLRAFAVVDLEAQAALCRMLADVVPDLADEGTEKACAAALAAAADPAVRPSELEEHVRTLRAAASAVVTAAYARGDPRVAEHVLAVVVDDARAQVDRERAWVRHAGFDVFRDALGSPAAATGA